LLALLSLFKLVLSPNDNIEGPEIRFEVLSVLVDEILELIHEERHL
jgi:hypothetical protein